MIKTVTTTANTELAVLLTGSEHVRIMNRGESDVYASASPGIVADADGVICISAGSTGALVDVVSMYTGSSIYLLSTGVCKVELETRRDLDFKSGSKGGGGTAPEYTVESESSTDYASVYRLKKDGVAVGDPINIPKDMVVQSGTVRTCTVANQPVSGLAVGDPYIDLLIANTDDQHIYIDAKTLVNNTAVGITYTNTSSGLTATNVQGAIDELADTIGDVETILATVVEV